MKVLGRVLILLIVIGLVAGAIYAAERIFQPQLADALGQGSQRGAGWGRMEQQETNPEHERGGFGQQRRHRGKVSNGILDEHFKPAVGLTGLGNDLILVGGVAATVIGVDYGFSRALRQCRRRAAQAGGK